MRAELLPRERLLMGLGAALLAATLLLAVAEPRPALGGWLAAATAFSAVSAGATYLVLAMRLVPGAWGEELRLAAEAGTLLTPLALVAFIPVMVGAGVIYPWAWVDGAGSFRAAWLGEFSFAVRTLLRFAALIWISHRMRRRRAPVATAAGGLVVLPLLASLTAVDWLMSLQPDFASSAFGLQFLAREALIAFCAIVLLRLSIGRPPARLGVAGGVLLTLLLIWAYLQYMSYLTAWSANLPPGAEWYTTRAQHGWGIVAALFAGLGAVAIVLLLFPAPRTRPAWLRAIALLVLASQAIETGWVVLPEFGPLAILAFGLGLAGFACLCAGAMPLALRHRIAARAPLRGSR